MFEDTSDDATYTKRRFNYTWNIFLLHYIDYLLLETKMFFSEDSISSFNLYFYLSVCIKFILHSCFFLFICFFKEMSYFLSILFELFSNNLSIESNSGLLLRAWLFELSGSIQFDSWTFGMMSEIISRSISTATNFKPSWWDFYLDIPTFLGIVCHLFGEKLSKTSIFFDINTNLFQV